MVEAPVGAAAKLVAVRYSEVTAQPGCSAAQCFICACSRRQHLLRRMEQLSCLAADRVMAARRSVLLLCSQQGPRLVTAKPATTLRPHFPVCSKGRPAVP